MSDQSSFDVADELRSRASKLAGWFALTLARDEGRDLGSAFAAAREFWEWADLHRPDRSGPALLGALDRWHKRDETKYFGLRAMLVQFPPHQWREQDALLVIGLALCIEAHRMLKGGNSAPGAELALYMLDAEIAKSLWIERGGILSSLTPDPAEVERLLARVDSQPLGKALRRYTSSSGGRGKVEKDSDGKQALKAKVKEEWKLWTSVPGNIGKSGPTFAKHVVKKLKVRLVTEDSLARWHNSWRKEIKSTSY